MRARYNQKHIEALYKTRPVSRDGHYVLSKFISRVFVQFFLSGSGKVMDKCIALLQLGQDCTKLSTDSKEFYSIKSTRGSVQLHKKGRVRPEGVPGHKKGSYTEWIPFKGEMEEISSCLQEGLHI